ncbi:choice-of-anchor I family protein [Pseudoroseomonas globiformis]|uniref:Choice-of-anchor I family protein n=1 Tax=Teichococcus globiformis TaxID=2307229 RepID=A0ABV7FZF1_9PROT
MSGLVGTPLWSMDNGAGAAGGAEMVAYDAARNLVLVLGAKGIEALDAATGASRFSLSAGALGSMGTANSVAVHGDVVAASFDGAEQGGNGTVALFRLATDGGSAELIRTVKVGATPDMVTFTPDGSQLLVAIEGEPTDSYATAENGSVVGDPVGGVATIDAASGESRFSGFTGFDTEALRTAGVRIAGVEGITAKTDLEPEYIAFSADGATAFVSLQENNAIGILDVASGEWKAIHALGTKDHSLEGQGLDTNDQDGVPNVVTAPVRGLYMPDGIATFVHDGQTYLVTANEGDASEWGDYSDVARIKDVALDSGAFPNAAELQRDEDIGRLEISTADGDVDGDGQFEALYSFGGRSFSIWEVTDDGLARTYDSAELMERMLAEHAPGLLDDGRSDNKGPEPESVVMGTIDGQLYAFVALERADSVMAFAINGPTEVEYAGIIATDDAPEVIRFISAEDAPAGVGGPMLIAPNEGSGITTAHRLEIEPGGEQPGDGTYTLQILHGSDFEAGLAAVERASQFAAIVDRLEDAEANSITLSSGDNFLPGPFIAAGTDSSIEEEYQDLYAWLLGVPREQLAGLSLSPAAADIAIMNAIGLQASVFGNHEWDLGASTVAAAIGFSGKQGDIGSIGALFPYLSANLDFSGDTGMSALFTEVLLSSTNYRAIAEDLASAEAIAAAAAAPQVSPWTTIEEGGETIGVLGVTTQLLASISSPGNVLVKDPASDGGANNTDELAAILQPFVDQMMAQGINKIVLLSHLQQYELEVELAGKLSGVDVIVAGGSHAVFANEGDTLNPGDTAAEGYPLFVEGADGHTVAVVNTANEYSYVGRLVVTFDKNGNIIRDSVDPAASGAYAVSEDTVSGIWGNEDAYADGTRGGEVLKLTDAIGEVIEAKDGNVFGYSDVFLEGRRSEVRTEETNLGNLTADANLFVARQVDAGVTVSIKNGGGIRAEIGTIGTGAEAEELPPAANPAAGKATGAVSQLDIENSLRFNNALSIVTVSAEDLVKVFEHAVAGVRDGATPGSFGQVGGVAFSYDATGAAQVLNADGGVATAGGRIRTLSILDEDGAVLDTIMQNGELVGDASRAIKMVTLTYLAEGGDGYPIGLYAQDKVDLTGSAALTEGAATFADRGTEQDALAEYLAARHATPETAYGAVDAGPATDERIQNLAVREDTVPVAGERPDEGGDRILGTDGDDVLQGTAMDDRILGGAGDDILAGGDGHDQLFGGDGDDIMIGGVGNDVYHVAQPGDIVIERAGQGTDRVVSRIDYALPGNVEKLQLHGESKTGTGNAQDNVIMGNALDNVLLGEAGNDVLRGGAGGDRLDGGSGNNRLWGDGEADTFVFSSLQQGDLQRIMDFAPGEDRLEFDGAVFTALSGCGNDGTLREDALTTTGAAATGATRLIYEAASGNLYYDADGKGGEAANRIGWIGKDLDLGASDIWVG